MKTATFLATALLFCGAVILSQAEARSRAKEAKEVSLDVPNQLTVKVR
jgi:hypothetical protein